MKILCMINHKNNEIYKTNTKSRLYVKIKRKKQRKYNNGYVVLS